MKRTKKFAALLLAAAMLTSTTACSSDNSWAAKDDSLTVPVGSYIFNLYSAYASAAGQVPDTTKPVLGQKIGDKDAEAWIREKALNMTKSIFVIDRKMKELKLSLTADDNTQIKDLTDQAWNSYQSTLEGYGIAKSSYNFAASDYSVKSQKVFDAIYGKGGSKAVADDELKSFFEKNYTDFSYILCPLYKTDSSGNFSSALSDDEKKKAEDTFNGYAGKITDGSMTLQQAADAYKAASGGDISVSSETTNLSTNPYGYPDDMVKLLQGMKAGETKAAEISDGFLYILVTKNDITKKTEDQMKTDDGRRTLLNDYKGKEFTDEISKEADALTGVTVNEKAVDSYNPSMFETEEEAS